MNDIPQTKPGHGGKRTGAGSKPRAVYTERYRADPDGSSTIRIPNRVLVWWERQAKEEGRSVLEWLSLQEIKSRII